jgi:PEP-CTERM motif
MILKVSALGASIAAALLLAPASALAATEVFTGGVPVDGSTFTLDQFDASLGTLTGVTLDLSIAGTLTIQVLNFGDPNAPIANASTNVAPLIDGPDGLQISTEIETSLTDGVAALSFLPSFSINNFTSGPLFSSATLAVTSADFSDFEGAGGVSYHAAFDPILNSIPYNTSGTPGPGANEAFGGAGPFTVTLGVTYTYDAVPEPAAWAMMLVGFGGLGAIMRRRKAAFA